MAIAYHPVYEVFVLVPHFGAAPADRAAVVGHWFSECDGTPLGVDLHYRRRDDVAVFAVRFDERTVTRRALEEMHATARGYDVVLIDPIDLDTEQRRRLEDSVLHGATPIARDARDPAQAAARYGRS